MARKRTERFELRMLPEEKEFLLQAAEKKGVPVADFVRFAAVELAKAIVNDKSPGETYHAVLMGVGRISPEVVLYSATADYTPFPEPKKEDSEDES